MHSAPAPPPSPWVKTIKVGMLEPALKVTLSRRDQRTHFGWFAEEHPGQHPTLILEWPGSSAAGAAAAQPGGGAGTVQPARNLPASSQTWTHKFTTLHSSGDYRLKAEPLRDMVRFLQLKVGDKLICQPQQRSGSELSVLRATVQVELAAASSSSLRTTEAAGASPLQSQQGNRELADDEDEDVPLQKRQRPNSDTQQQPAAHLQQDAQQQHQQPGNGAQQQQQQQHRFKSEQQTMIQQQEQATLPEAEQQEQQRQQQQHHQQQQPQQQQSDRPEWRAQQALSPEEAVHAWAQLRSVFDRAYPRLPKSMYFAVMCLGIFRQLLPNVSQQSVEAAAIVLQGLNNSDADQAYARTIYVPQHFEVLREAVRQNAAGCVALAVDALAVGIWPEANQALKTERLAGQAAGNHRWHNLQAVFSQATADNPVSVVGALDMLEIYGTTLLEEHSAVVLPQGSLTARWDALVGASANNKRVEWFMCGLLHMPQLQVQQRSASGVALLLQLLCEWAAQ